MIERILGFMAVGMLIAGLGLIQIERVKQVMLAELMKMDRMEGNRNAE